MNNLAHTWHSLQKFHDALALMEECLTLGKEVLGPSHPDFISSSRSLRNWKDCATSPINKHSQRSGQAEGIHFT
ncbi:hypothetical protein BDV19DRAFT_374202, partial [Aspergillus venezuelensis]